MTDYDGKYREIGNRLIMQYQKEGTVPAGVNGPYDDKESIGEKSWPGIWNGWALIFCPCGSRRASIF